jgi:hypothetical protein
MASSLTFLDKHFFLVDKKANQVRVEIQKNPEMFILSNQEKRKAYAYGKRYCLILFSFGLYTFANIRRINELISLKIRRFTPTQLIPIISYNAVIALVTYILGHVFFYDRFIQDLAVVFDVVHFRIPKILSNLTGSCKHSIDGKSIEILIEEF